MAPLRKIQPTLKSGLEQLSVNEKPNGFSLLDFWQWSVSDILSNATRGRFAEFVIATAIGVDIKEVRDEWGAFDLISPEGVKIEVKSAAYIQSWDQKELSKIIFSTKLSQPWDSKIDRRSIVPIRSADIYVFCLLHHSCKQTCDPLNMDHWEFYVLTTQDLNNYRRSQHSISLKSLQRLTNTISYENLREVISIENSNISI